MDMTKGNYVFFLKKKWGEEGNVEADDHFSSLPTGLISGCAGGFFLSCWSCTYVLMCYAYISFLLSFFLEGLRGWEIKWK